MPGLDDERLLSLLREYVRAADSLQALGAQDQPRRTLELAEQKSVAGMAVRRRLIELGWVPPILRKAERDIDV